VNVHNSSQIQMNSFSSWEFLEVFVILISLLSGLDSYLQIPSSFYIYPYLFGFLKTIHSSSKKNIWWILSILHILAHVLFPAYLSMGSNSNSIRQTPNPDFNPIFDYWVHALQCFCIFLLTKSAPLRIVGTLFGVCMLGGALYVQIDPNFLTTFLWKCLSFGGVFGTICHHLLLDFNDQLLKLNLFIWCSPYIGYLLYDSTTIWMWDEKMHKIGYFTGGI